MVILKAKYADGKAFLGAYQPSSQHSGLFIPTRKKLPLGSAVIVDVHFPALRSAVLLKGYIAWRRAGENRSKLRAGLGIDFLDSEKQKLTYVLGVAKGEIVDIAQRRFKRLPVEIRVGWRLKTDREWHIDQVEDIAEGGAFIRTTQFLPVGTMVILEIIVPGGQRTIAIEAEVIWTRHTQNEEGIGVEFKRRDSGGARLLQEIVRRIEVNDKADNLATGG